MKSLPAGRSRVSAITARKLLAALVLVSLGLLAYPEESLAQSTCQPDWPGFQTKCRQLNLGEKQVFSGSVLPYQGVLPGKYDSVSTLIGVVNQGYQALGFCYYDASSVTGPRNQSYEVGILKDQEWDYTITLGFGVPCIPTLAGTGNIIDRQPWRCDNGWAPSTLGGMGLCVCWWDDCILPRPAKGDGCTANPCEVASGNKRQEEVDYRSGAPSALQFTRTYNSKFKGNFDGDGSVSYALGGWMASYLQRVSYANTPPHSGAYVYRPDGTVLLFSEASGVFSVLGEVAEKLDWVLDGGGAKVGFRLKTATDSVELYSLTGKLLSISTKSGIVQTLTYDSLGYLSTVVDSFGNSMQFQWSTNAPPKKLVGITLPGSLQLVYAYDGSGRLSSVTYPDSTLRTYHYELTDAGRLHLLTGITDESSVRFATWTYDAGGVQVLSSEHAGGVEHYDFVYNADGSRQITYPSGVSRTYATSVVGGQRRFSSGSGAYAGANFDAATTYDANGNFASRTDFNGNQTTYVNDLARNLETSRTEAFGTAKARTITTVWHPNYRIPTSIAEPNRTTTFTHDPNGNVLTRTVTDTSVVPNVARTWTYTYNSFGRVLTEDGPRSDVTDVTTYTYYTCTTGFQCGQVNTITNAAGHITTYNAYNAHGQPTQITDANGLVTSLAYDMRRRLADRCTGATLPGCFGGELTHLDYWPTGLLKKVTNPDASYIEYTYDAAHRLTEIKDGALNKIVYTLDNVGNRTAENTYDPSLNLKRTHSRVFNTLNQLWKDVNAAGTANVTTVFGYDTNGNQTTVNAPLSRNSTSLYDELNRLKQITDPSSGNTLFGYDANDNLTSVTDPRSLVTNYTYTGFGDLKTQTSPDTGLTTNTYDSGGNLKTSTDARSAITTYTYDVMNRVGTAAFKIGSTTDQTITYTYDAGTNGKGQLTGATDANHSLSWAYNAQGRVTGKGQLVTGLTTAQSIGYGYNALGQLASIALPSGKTIAYGYNTNGQVTSVTLNGSPNVTILSNVTYDPFGPITGWTWGNGTASTSRTFDTDGKLTALSNTPATTGNRTFGFDDAFRITSSTDSLSSALNWTLGYDLLDRLNSATKTGTTIGYTYDADGNRLTQTGTSASTYTLPGTSNKLSSVSGALTRTYTYDAVGNVFNSGATSHTYYNNGRMKTGKLGAASATTYLYNALGQRIKKSGGPQATTVFMYDEAGHLVGEYTISSGAAVRVQETVWFGDIPIATLRTNGANVDVFYVHTDQLNTPRKVTVSTGMNANKLRWKWDPTPFGEGAPNENPASLGAFKYNLRFPGQYFDVETNLNYNYFRDYDPATGRYSQSDPIGLAGGLNVYGYVDANPLSSLDPLGLAHCWPTWNRYKDFQTENLKDPLPQYSHEYTSFRPGGGIQAGPGYSLPRPGHEGGLNMGASIELEVWDVVDKTETQVNGYRHRFRWITEYICEEVGACGETRRWSEVREERWNPWRQMIVDMKETKETLWLRKVGSIWVEIGNTPSIPRR